MNRLISLELFAAHVARTVTLFSLMFVLLGSFVQAAIAGSLDIVASNAMSGVPLADLEIHAMESGPEGELNWRRSGLTDAQGRLSMSLPGLGEGAEYVLASHPYNGGFAFSNIIDSAGSYAYQLGALEVTAISGLDGSTLGNHRVGALEIIADDSMVWAAEGTTDSAGLVRLDLPGLASGRRYALYSFLPGDDSFFVGKELVGNGQVQFQVGHPQMVVQVVDGLSEQPMAGQEVFLSRQQPPDEPQWIASGVTDAAGGVTFDMPDFGEADVFQLATEAFNGVMSHSAKILTPGEVTFRVGKLQVAVVSGADGTPMADFPVMAMERLADDSDVFTAWGKTDAEGDIRFDLAGLGEGRNYVISARSPVDDSVKTSAVLTTNGEAIFTVGNRPLNLTLTNGVHGELLAEQLVFVLLVDTDGSTQGIASGLTDEEGKISFDIDLPVGGGLLQLTTQPYNGGWVYSDIISEPGDIQFEVGRLPVRLRDANSGAQMPGQFLILFERLDNGDLVPVASGSTDDQGIVAFDAPGLGAGSTYSIYAENLYGMGASFFSPWITSIGPVDFLVSADGEYHYDTTAPELVVLAPDQNQAVSVGGFLINGTVNDNQAVGEVVIEVVDPNLGTSIFPVAVSNGHWNHVVSGDILSPSDSLSVTVTAYDRVGNETVVGINLHAVEDTVPPNLIVQSHEDQDVVSAGGFMLTGFATDHLGLREVTATIVDSTAGALMTDHRLELAPDSGTWALTVDQLTAGGQLQVEIVAKGFDGQETSNVLSLNVVEASASMMHVISRITFGASPELLNQTRGQDAAMYINQQLNPDSIDESALESMLSGYGMPESLSDIQDYQTLRASFAKRQLLEKMTWFWDNHFNTDLRKSGSAIFELRDNQQFRIHAMGKFRDLLEVSATSPAMLLYLDNVNNVNTGPNENYAREMLELHTVGVDGGFTEADVVNTARVFTGWSIQDGEFHFFDVIHDPGSKVVMGETFYGGSGESEGQQLLDFLATHPSTASHLCTKLQQYLVSDEPAPQAVADCADVFLSSGGDIGEVVAWILQSPAFSAPEALKSKVKSPFEFLIGLVRSLSPQMPYEHVRSFQWMLGMPSFLAGPPTGWSELGVDWINADQLSQRTLAAITMIFNVDIEHGMFLESPAAWCIDQGYETEEAVLGFLVELAGSGTYSGLVWEEARNILRGDELFFDIHGDRQDVDFRLRSAATVMLSAPDYQLQ